MDQELKACIDELRAEMDQKVRQVAEAVFVSIDRADRSRSEILFKVDEVETKANLLVKQRIYASADIPQYAIVNLIDSRVEVFEKPDFAKGRYRWHAELAEDKEIGLLLPEHRRLIFPVTDWLP